VRKHSAVKMYWGLKVTPRVIPLLGLRRSERSASCSGRKKYKSMRYFSLTAHILLRIREVQSVHFGLETGYKEIPRDLSHSIQENSDILCRIGSPLLPFRLISLHYSSYLAMLYSLAIHGVFT
jgi:hypothetical protein